MLCSPCRFSKSISPALQQSAACQWILYYGLDPFYSVYSLFRGFFILCTFQEIQPLLLPFRSRYSARISAIMLLLPVLQTIYHACKKHTKEHFKGVYSADHAPYTDPWKLVYRPWYEQYNKKNIPAWGNKKEASKETDMKDPSSASLPQN